MTTKVATVFGGSGFLGRYIVRRLAADGHEVRVAVRWTDRALFLKPMGQVGQIVPLCAPITDEAGVARALDGTDWVVNLVGILAERHAGDFQHIHAEGAGRVARLAQAAGAQALVQLSAIGADPASPSRYGASKAAGEATVRAAFPDATILRPSILFGPEDHFFNRFASMARWMPMLPVMAGETKFQPVYVDDVAGAVVAALTRPDARGAVYELGGPDVMTFRALLAWILRETGLPRRLVGIPPALARMQAALLEHLPGRLLTRDQLLMLGRDNIVSPGMPGLAELGIVATPLALVVPNYLRRYRPGGGRRPIPGAAA